MTRFCSIVFRWALWLTAALSLALGQVGVLLSLGCALAIGAGWEIIAMAWHRADHLLCPDPSVEKVP